MNIENKWRLLNEVIEDLPEEYIRQVKINYDAKFISIIFLEKLQKIIENKDENKKIIFSELKYYNYEMKDIYYLISKFSYILMIKNYTIAYYPNYKKDGYNLFINNIIFSVYIEDDSIIFEFVK